MTLVRRDPPLLEEPEHARFERVVRRALSQRRKTMFKLLKGDWAEDRLSAAFQQLGLDLQIRGEKLSLEQFVALTRALAGTPDA